MEKSEKKIYGLLGFPLGHSLSPKMHNAAFQALGIDAEYKLFEIKPEGISDFLFDLTKNKIHGFNVTVPYKEIITQYLSWKSAEVEAVGAVNTVRVLEGRCLKGYNTDSRGFFTHLKSDLMFDPKGRTVAVIGAGGGAKAVCFALAQKGAGQIAVYDVDQDKAQNLVNRIQDRFPKCALRVAKNIYELAIKKSQLLVNATPIGLKNGDPSLVQVEDLHADLLVYDLIYNPAETELLKLAKRSGARASNGLGMLFYQGAEAFERLTDIKLPVDVRNEMWRHLVS